MSIFHRLTFIKKQHEHGDIYTFYFKKPQNMTFKAGQHGLFIIPGLYRPHPFSFSSSPDELDLAFSTHVETGSRFKDKLMKLDENDHIFLIGPVLNFTFVPKVTNHVFLAQGIGITPFRSMLAYAYKHSLPVKTTLVHVDSTDHTFRSYTEASAPRAFYPTSPDEFREIVNKQDKNQQYYLSGSPRFVKATRELLEKHGIERTMIKSDSFFGY